MTTPLYRVLHGTFVVRGHSLDGGTLRFVPDRPHELDALPSTHRLRFATDGSVCVKLEGIDAPAIHYENLSQPFGEAARRALLAAVGLKALVFDDEGIVRDGVVDRVRGSVLTRAIDIEGRVIAYVLIAPPTDGGGVDPTLLLRTVNATLLRSGAVYPLAYDTQPRAHRAAFSELARRARTERIGIWRSESSRSFRLTDRCAIAHAAQILPKLFRRCVAYLDDRNAGARSLRDWLESEAGGDNDVILVGDELVRLSQVMGECEGLVTVAIDSCDAVFVAR
jgi:endonuclease YncB( thermonuclease family)